MTTSMLAADDFIPLYHFPQITNIKEFIWDVQM